jgi:ribosomal protein L31
MKADIHPNYRDVVFHDVTSDFKFLTRSTMADEGNHQVGRRQRLPAGEG